MTPPPPPHRHVYSKPQCAYKDHQVLSLKPLFLQISIVRIEEISSCQADAHTTAPSHDTTALLMHLQQHSFQHALTNVLPSASTQHHCPIKCLHTTLLPSSLPSHKTVTLHTTPPLHQVPLHNTTICSAFLLSISDSHLVPEDTQ